MRFILTGAALAIAVSTFGQDANLSIAVNGETVRFNGAGPQRVQGRVLVPLRGVLEKMGAVVEWDGASRTVVAQRGNNGLRLRLGDRTAIVNGNTVTLDVPAMQILGSTMVPLRFIGEALGAEVKFDALTSMINIVTDGSSGGGNTGGGNTGGGNTGGGNTGSGMPSVRTFNISGPAWARADSEYTFRLEGSAGGRADVLISGIRDSSGRDLIIALNETSSGVYTGSWRPPTGIAVSEAAVVGRLASGNQERLIQAGRTISVDGAAPVIRSQSPSSGTVTSSANQEISAAYSDEGSGIDPTKVSLRVNGTEVGTKANITSDFIFYRPDTAWKTGANTVDLTVRDKAGNESKSTWNFNVESSASNVDIKLFTHNAGKGVPVGGSIAFRLDAAPGSKVTLNAGPIRNLALKESPAGVYRASYVVKAADDFNNDPVIATIKLADGREIRAESAVRIPKSPAQAALTITQPKAGASVNDPLVVRGTGDPRSKVKVRVDYATTVVALRVTGLIKEVTVNTDLRGLWITEEIPLKTVVSGTDTEYTITITQLDASGAAVGKPVTMKVKRS